jgi:hypothetical protein
MTIDTASRSYVTAITAEYEALNTMGYSPLEVIELVVDAELACEQAGLDETDLMLLTDYATGDTTMTLEAIIADQVRRLA